MIRSFLISLAAAYIAAEIYTQFATPQQKQKWEKFVKTHHGEAGVLIATAGLAAKSPGLIGSGIGLMIHDKDDVNKWFKKSDRKY